MRARIKHCLDRGLDGNALCGERKWGAGVPGIQGFLALSPSERCPGCDVAASKMASYPIIREAIKTQQDTGKRPSVSAMIEDHPEVFSGKPRRECYRILIEAFIDVVPPMKHGHCSQ